MMLIDAEKIYCSECIYVGEYDDTEDKMQTHKKLLGSFRENHFVIRRRKIRYSVMVNQRDNRKTIVITSNQKSIFSDMYNLITEIIRFENLFEGFFFSVNSFTIDGIERINLIQEMQLAYYNSKKRYTGFVMNFSNKSYISYFHRWLKLEKKNKIIHPVFLYSTYLEGMPVDIRMALLLETFEPLAEILHNKGGYYINKVTV